MQGDALRSLLQDELIASDVQCSQLVAHAALQIAGVSTDAFPARPVRNFSMVYVQVPVYPNQPPQVGACLAYALPLLACRGKGMCSWRS